MTIKNTIKKVEKTTGLTPVWKKHCYSLILNGYELSFVPNGGNDENTDAICICLRRIGDESNSMTDYCAGTFYNNITQALNGLLNK